MKLKLVKVSTKSFVLIFSIINTIIGLILGALITLLSLLPVEGQAPNPAGAWAILIFPIVNGILSMATGTLLTGLYNFFAEKFGGLELEFKE